MAAVLKAAAERGELEEVPPAGALDEQRQVAGSLFRFAPFGRFDRLIYIPAPDSKALKEIFKIHAKGMPLSKDVDLDQVAPVHPVKLTHRTGHAYVLNSLALKQVGISKETPDPQDGLIERDIETGRHQGDEH
jgi:SpoVK/Ycf46/Vps4 family AAA+-type ATPase